MLKYNPEESITCPKCGIVYATAQILPTRFTHNLAQYQLDRAEVGMIQGDPEIGEPAIVIACGNCHFTFIRAPLDYDGIQEPT